MKQEPDLLPGRRNVDAQPGPVPVTGVWMRGLGALVRRCTARNERLQVCETVSLGGRRGVALIECDGQRFLAGLSAAGVETLVPVDGTGRRGDLR